MSVVRILLIRCDGCGRTADGSDPRYNVRSLRKFLRTLGWSTRGKNGQGSEELCPTCVRSRVSVSEDATPREISTRRVQDGVVHEHADFGTKTQCGLDLREPWTWTDDPVTCEACQAAEEDAEACPICHRVHEGDDCGGAYLASLRGEDRQ